MQRIGTLQGTGRLQVGARDFGYTEYRLSVWREDRGGFLSAAGSLSGAPAALSAALSWGECTLTLASGRPITVLVRRIENGGTRAEVRVSGPVPEP